MFNAFSQMAVQLEAIAEQKKNHSTPKPPRKSTKNTKPPKHTVSTYADPDLFVYDQNSPLLKAAIIAHHEFNKRRWFAPCVVVVVKDTETKKCAVFGTLGECATKLGFGKPSDVSYRLYARYQPSKNLTFAASKQPEDPIVFQQPHPKPVISSVRY